MSSHIWQGMLRRLKEPQAGTMGALWASRSLSLSAFSTRALQQGSFFRGGRLLTSQLWAPEARVARDSEPDGS